MSDFLIGDKDTTSWWQALCQGKLMIQSCGDCGHLRWPSRAICNDCGSFEARDKEAAGTATVASWTVSHRPFMPGFPVPHTVVLARLDEQDDILIPGILDKGGNEDLRLQVGSKLKKKVRFAPGTLLPTLYWQLVTD